MPNDYIDQVKLSDNTIVDIKDTVSGYITAAGAPVQSVNGQTGAVSLSIPSTASDVGAIADPSSKSNGQYLKYNGTNWVADSVPDELITVTVTIGDVSISCDTTKANLVYYINNNIPLNVVVLYSATGARTASVEYMKTYNDNILFSYASDATIYELLYTNNGITSSYRTIPTTASDVDAIADPSTKSDGQFLKYNGTNWVADSLPGGASPSDVSPNMDGTASAGTSAAYSRGDHVHPTDTSRQVKITASGILKGNGSGTITAAEAGTDYQAPITFDGTYNASSNKAATVSTVTNAINALDGGTIGTGGTTKTITSLSQTNGNVSATFGDIAFPVTSVNTKTGAVSLTASDIGAQATLVSGTNIKTVNNESLLGSGNIDISGGGGSTLFVTATYANYTYTADTTYADMMSAISTGKDIVVISVDSNQQKTWYYAMVYAPKTTTENFCFASEDEFGTFKHLLVNNADVWWAADEVDLSSYAKKASPTFTGTPKAPTAAAGTDTTQIATTAFVQGEKKNLIAAGNSSVEITSLANLKTQLNTWFATMSDATVAYFWLKVTTAFFPFQTGDKIVRLKRATSAWGFAEFFSDFGSTSTTNMRYFGGSEIAMSFVNGTWQDPAPIRAHLANYYDYSDRPTDADTAIPFSQYDGSLSNFKVTSSMTSNYPVTSDGTTKSTGHVLNASWDYTGDYTTQLYLPIATADGTSGGGTRHVQLRGNYNGTWKDWEKLAWLKELSDNPAYASVTSISSLANLKTQLNTWYANVPNNTMRTFYFTPSGTWFGSVASGTGVLVVIERAATNGTASFYSRINSVPFMARMTYYSSAWSDPYIMATTADINTAIGSAILASY